MSNILKKIGYNECFEPVIGEDYEIAMSSKGLETTGVLRCVECRYEEQCTRCALLHNDDYMKNLRTLCMNTLCTANEREDGKCIMLVEEGRKHA